MFPRALEQMVAASLPPATTRPGGPATAGGTPQPSLASTGGRVVVDRLVVDASPSGSFEPVEQLASAMKAEMNRLAKVIKEAGIRGE